MSIGGNSTDLSESKSSSPLSNPIQSWRKIYTKKDKEIEQLLERVESYLDQNLTGSQKEQILFGIQDTDWGVKVSLSADKVFAHESAKINREAVAPLLAVGRLLKELNHGVIIENHYGNEPIKNNQYPSAWELTSMRSTKLLRFLMQQQSLSAEKMTAAGFANSRLISSSSQKVDKARNRRVDILILNENDFY